MNMSADLGIPASPCNPFTCERCGNKSDGPIRIHVSASYPSGYDNTIIQDGSEHVVCDGCFRAMMANPADRVWLADTRNSSYLDIVKLVDDHEHNLSFAYSCLKQDLDAMLDRTWSTTTEMLIAIRNLVTRLNTHNQYYHRVKEDRREKVNNDD